MEELKQYAFKAAGDVAALLQGSADMIRRSLAEHGGAELLGERVPNEPLHYQQKTEEETVSGDEETN